MTFPFRAATALCNGYDVVKFEPLAGFTFDTTPAVPLPHEQPYGLGNPLTPSRRQPLEVFKRCYFFLDLRKSFFLSVGRMFDARGDFVWGYKIRALNLKTLS